MIRNLLYSLFLHSILITFIFLNFNFQEFQENESKSKITVSFMVKPGNSENSAATVSDLSINPKKEIKPDKKTPKSSKKDKKNKVKKVSKSSPKTKSNEVITKNIDKPKANDGFKKTEEIAQKQESVEKSEVKNAIKKAEEIIKEPEEKTQKEKTEEVETKEIKEEEDDEELSEDQEQNPDASEVTKKLETLDLSLREKFNIEWQIRRCYKNAISEAGSDGKSIVNIHIIIEKDGTIDPDSVSIQDFEKYNDPKEIDFHIAVDNAKRALTLCSPLRNLPEDKYEIWREIDLQFDENMK